MTEKTKAKTKILFVCTGNICRSPTAEAVLRHLAEQHSIDIEIDSAGTSDWHQGEKIDKRAAQCAALRGYETDAIRSRPIKPDDFIYYDLIFGMTATHCDEMQQAIRHSPHAATYAAKIKLFLAATLNEPADVPDPYYGDSYGFDHMLDLIENGCRALIQSLKP